MASGKVRRRALTEAEVEDSIRAAEGALAAAERFLRDDSARDDARQALRGNITFDEAIRRAFARAQR